MAITIRVVPVEGRTLPVEGAPSRNVDSEREVPNTAYYRRAIARGDIELAPAKPARVKREES